MTRREPIDHLLTRRLTKDGIEIDVALSAAPVVDPETRRVVGGIVSHGDINTVVAAGRADMCALARGYLEDAYFTRHAARAQGYAALKWPSQYRRAGEVQLRGE